ELMVRCKLWIVCLLGLFLVAAEAKEVPGQTVVWPENGQPILRFVFGKFKEGPAYGREHNYTCETTAQNLWGKKIDAVFSLYLFDKSNVRVGEGYVQIKFQTTFHAAGVPVTLKLVPQTLPPELRAQAPRRSISITINS